MTANSALTARLRANADTRQVILLYVIAERSFRDAEERGDLVEPESFHFIRDHKPVPVVGSSLLVNARSAIR